MLFWWYEVRVQVRMKARVQSTVQARVQVQARVHTQRGVNFNYYQVDSKEIKYWWVLISNENKEIRYILVK